MKGCFMNETLDGSKGNARVLNSGFGVKLMKKPMHEKTSGRFIQELKRTISHVSTTCAYAILYVYMVGRQHDGSSWSLSCGDSRRKDKLILLSCFFIDKFPSTGRLLLR